MRFGMNSVSNQGWGKVTEWKMLLTHRHSLNALSQARPNRTLELVETTKSLLPITCRNILDVYQ